MKEFILKIFEFFKNFLEFLKVLILFLLVNFILYWTQNIAGFSWEWLDFFKPLFDFFVEIGRFFSLDYIIIFSAKFDYSYFIAVIVFIFIYILLNFVQIGFEKLKEIFLKGHNVVKSFEEKNFNKSLKVKQSVEQKKIKRFQVYVETFIKSEFLKKDIKIDLLEQNKIMNKFLVENTKVCPQNFGNGFIYTFETFSEIDNILSIFRKIINSKTPLDFVICVQVIGSNHKEEDNKLKKLISLKMINKIITSSDTVYRYSFNDICKFEASQLGLFQKENGTFEVHEFIEKNENE